LGKTVAESFFSTLKQLRVRRQTYATRDDPWVDMFDFIELFYNSKKRQSHVGSVSPQQFEADYFARLSGL
jgi:putative transposase